MIYPPSINTNKSVAKEIEELHCCILAALNATKQLDQYMEVLTSNSSIKWSNYTQCTVVQRNEGRNAQGASRRSNIEIHGYHDLWKLYKIPRRTWMKNHHLCIKITFSKENFTFNCTFFLCSFSQFKNYYSEFSNGFKITTIAILYGNQFWAIYWDFQWTSNESCLHCILYKLHFWKSNYLNLRRIWPLDGVWSIWLTKVSLNRN